MSLTTLGLSDLLDLLGYTPDEFVAICHQRPGEAFTSDVVAAPDAGSTVERYRDGADVWFGVNPTAGPARESGGRGTAGQVTRLVALYADLDVKPGGLASYDVAHAVISDVSGMLGASPVAVTLSGHGLQPIWAVEHEDATRDQAITRPLLRRFGRFVAHVAEVHGGHVDSVFDLARVLRAPGTTNRKAEPVPVLTFTQGGAPIAVEAITETLDNYNIPDLPEDDIDLGTVVSGPSEWTYGDRDCSYGQRMVDGWAHDTPTARHPWLVSQATRLAAAHRHGCLTADGAQRAAQALSARFLALLGTGQQRKPQPAEVNHALSWGQARVAAMTDDRVARELGGHTHRQPDTQPGPPPPIANEETEFWAARTVLEHIQLAAIARRCSPWAMLGAVLTRVITAVPPFVVLPPLVGGDASLNMFVGLVGESGSGKGAAITAAGRVVDIGAPIETAGVGSGEGIAHLFVKRTKEGVEQHTKAVLFTVAEIDTLSALGDRRGATLLPELRKAWSGEDLGFGYADPTKRLPVPAHQYRLCVVAGIQPGRAQALLSDVDGGTPQRFLWLPATDPTAPEVAPQAPLPLPWRPPMWPTADPRSYRSTLGVCGTARTTIDTERVKRLRGEENALDGHGLLTQLKTAAALALLDRRTDITDEDWQLAGVVAGVSDRTREAVQTRLVDAERKHNEAIGRSEGIRQQVAAEHLAEVAIKRVCKAVVRRLQREVDGAWIAKSALRTSVTSRDRAHYNDALERLLDAGQIEIRQADRTEEGHGGLGTLYRLVR